MIALFHHSYMKNILSTIILLLVSTLVCLGQSHMKVTPIKDVIQGWNHQTFCIKAHYGALLDTVNLVIVVEEDDYVIPVRLQKRDLGAEKRFLVLDLKEGDVIAVKGVLNDIRIDGERVKGLVDAVILDEEDLPEEEPATESEDDRPSTNLLDVKPMFRGGDAMAFSEWVNGQLRYPASARKKGIQGCVTIQFTVEPDGHVSNIKVLRGVEKSLDKEAVRVVSSSHRWPPGYLAGKSVRVTHTFPVIFQLQ